MPRDEITNVKQLKTFVTNVRQLGDKELSKQLNKGLRDVVKPVLADARSAAQSIPTTGRNRTGLRAAIARSLGIRSGGGRVRIQVNPRRLPAGKQALPRLLEGPHSFRHRVWGEDVWVDQRAYPWLEPTGRKHEGTVRTGIQQVAQDIFDELEKKVR